MEENLNLRKEDENSNSSSKQKPQFAKLNVILSIVSAILLITSIVLLILLLGTNTQTPSDPTVSVSDDGYLVVNGVKTDFEVKNNNHSFGLWEMYGQSATDCEKQLLYRICSHCDTIEWRNGDYSDHSFSVVTTEPTCIEGGYDTKTCDICGKEEILNHTQVLAHEFSDEYLSDNVNHWQECKNCKTESKKEEHSLNNSGECDICGQPIGDTEGITYDLSDDGTYAMVVGYNGTATKIKIAESYNGVPVKEIYSEAFKSTKITSVVIPDSVTTIGEYAFYSCSSLTSVVIGNSVTTIGDSAFNYCSSLTSVVIGDSVTTIGQHTFYCCTSLTSVVIPDSVTTIGYEAFYSCSSLTSVVIGDSVTYIGNYAFCNCSSLTSVVIPDSVTTIGDSAFIYCSSLKEVYYTGSEEQWAKISIGSYNDPLKNATKHYNYVPKN